MKTQHFFRPLGATFFLASLVLSPFSAFAEDFDPFAAPPKNLKQEDTGGYGIQSYVLQGPPPPPPPPIDADITETTDGTIEEMNYTGQLMPGESATAEENSYELLLDSGEIIPISTKKDLASYLGKKVTITAITKDGDFEIQKMYVHREEDISMKTAPAPETIKQSETEALKAAATGSGLWIAIAALAIFLASVGYGFFKKEQVVSWAGNFGKKPKDHEKE
ncbi:hypothetical protein IPN35_06530 [Candidatus Peregrinibacteria bacterium]|nr:MAG: hypothetical protein IPN35_06530 [Candidatus Peregrinibacteria bacterium]